MRIQRHISSDRLTEIICITAIRLGIPTIKDIAITRRRLRRLNHISVADRKHSVPGTAIGIKTDRIRILEYIKLHLNVQGFARVTEAIGIDNESVVTCQDSILQLTTLYNRDARQINAWCGLR